ncbi:hypothetical protein [Candidatus Poriferisodalis sp.]|uniref:hypothetical protein n=1 Tax=Candidatus Poriferisodalis sp. TaxID=3101277 RepID=UPI003B5C10EF
MRRDPPRAFMWASIGMCVVLAAFVVHMRTAVVAGGPVAVPDVPAYLGIAQWVGGDGLALGHIPFQPGYGLVVAPLVAVGQVSLLGTQGEAVHYLALVVNSLAAVAAVVVAGRLGLVGSRRWWVAGAAGLVAAVHPSLSSASRIAWPETLLSLFVLIVALAVAFAVLHAGSAASQRAWARAGLFATLAVALHARMIVLVVAVVATALLCRIGRRAWAAFGAGLVAGGAATAVALTLTDTWPAERLSEAAQLDRGAEPVATVSGQLLALSGGTLGLGLIGLVAGLGVVFEFVRRRPSDEEDALTAPARPAATTGGLFGRRPPEGRMSGDAERSPAARMPREHAGIPGALSAALVCLAIGAFGAVLLGGWTLTGSARADALLYGRYVDPWAVPLAVVALAWLAARPTTPRGGSSTSGVGASPGPASFPRSPLPSRGSAVLGTAVAVAVVTCAVVVGVAGGYDAAPRRIMTLSLSPAWAWLDERLSAVAVAALVLTLLGVLLAAAALRRRAVLGEDETSPPPISDMDRRDTRQRTAKIPDIALVALVAAVLVLGAVATVSNHRHLADVGAVARDQVVSAGTVSEAVDDGLTCLAHDRSSVPEYALWLYRLELPEITHERVQLEAGDRPCSELVIAHDDLAQRCTNARHLVDEPAASWALWHLPERTCVAALNMEARTAGVASHDGSHDSGIRSG